MGWVAGTRARGPPARGAPRPAARRSLSVHGPSVTVLSQPALDLLEPQVPVPHPLDPAPGPLDPSRLHDAFEGPRGEARVVREPGAVSLPSLRALGVLGRAKKV